MPSLYRIFAREVDAGQRFSAAGDSSAAQSAGFNLVSLLNPWRKIIGIAKKSKQALLTAFQWVCVFCHAGVEIPMFVFLELTSLSSTMALTFEECDDLLKTLLCSVWLRSIGKYDLQKAVEELHGRLASSLNEQLEDESRAMNSSAFHLLLTWRRTSLIGILVTISSVVLLPCVSFCTDVIGKQSLSWVLCCKRK